MSKHRFSSHKAAPVTFCVLERRPNELHLTLSTSRVIDFPRADLRTMAIMDAALNSKGRMRTNSLKFINAASSVISRIEFKISLLDL